MGQGDVIGRNIGQFYNFLKKNPKLTHLNLTAINLPQNHMVDLIHYIKTSTSLHIVHLCGNNLDECHRNIKKKLKPTYINRMI